MDLHENRLFVTDVYHVNKALKKKKKTFSWNFMFLLLRSPARFYFSLATKLFGPHLHLEFLEFLSDFILHAFTLHTGFSFQSPYSGFVYTLQAIVWFTFSKQMVSEFDNFQVFSYLYVCMYVCIYVCMYIVRSLIHRMYIYIYIYIYIIYTSIYILQYIYVQVHIHTYPLSCRFGWPTPAVWLWELLEPGFMRSALQRSKARSTRLLLLTHVQLFPSKSLLQHCSKVRDHNVISVSTCYITDMYL